jgi:hypothetical protein
MTEPINMAGWIKKLEKRWGVSTYQVFIILLVFSCTGFTIVFLKKPIFSLFSEGGELPLWASILYYILILPIYNIVLLIYGFLFGQFDFFWAYEKRFFKRILGRK